MWCCLRISSFILHSTHAAAAIGGVTGFSLVLCCFYFSKVFYMVCARVFAIVIVRFCHLFDSRVLHFLFNGRCDRLHCTKICHQNEKQLANTHAEVLLVPVQQWYWMLLCGMHVMLCILHPYALIDKSDHIYCFHAVVCYLLYIYLMMANSNDSSHFRSFSMEFQYFVQ